MPTKCTACDKLRHTRASRPPLPQPKPWISYLEPVECSFTGTLLTRLRNPTAGTAISIHPQLIEKDGRKELTVLPYEEFLQMREEIENHEDLRTLRAEKVTAHAEVVDDSEAPGGQSRGGIIDQEQAGTMFDSGKQPI